MTRLQVWFEAFALRYPRLWRDQVHIALAMFAINIPLGMILGLLQAWTWASTIFLFEVIGLVYLLTRDRRLRAAGQSSSWPSMAVNVGMMYFVGLPLVLSFLLDPRHFSSVRYFNLDVDFDRTGRTWIEGLIIFPFLASSLVQCADRLRLATTLLNIVFALIFFVILTTIIRAFDLAHGAFFEEPLLIGMALPALVGVAIGNFQNAKGRLTDFFVVIIAVWLNLLIFSIIILLFERNEYIEYDLFSGHSENVLYLFAVLFIAFFVSMLTALMIGEVLRWSFRPYTFCERQGSEWRPLRNMRVKNWWFTEYSAKFAALCPIGWRESWHYLLLLTVVNFCFASPLVIDRGSMQPVSLSESSVSEFNAKIAILIICEYIVISYIWLRDLPIRGIQRFSARPSLFSMSIALMIVYFPLWPLLVGSSLADSTNNLTDKFEGMTKIFVGAPLIIFVMCGFLRSIILFGFLLSIFGLFWVAFGYLCLLAVFVFTFSAMETIFLASEEVAGPSALVAISVVVVALWILLLKNSLKGRMSTSMSIIMLWLIVGFGYVATSAIQTTFFPILQGAIHSSQHFSLMTLVAFIIIASAALLSDAMIVPVSRQHYLPGSK